MDSKNIVKILGVAGLVITGKSYILPVIDLVNNKDVDNKVVIYQEARPNVVIKAFEDVGMPQLRVWNVGTTSVAGVYLIPSIVDSAINQG